MQLLPSSNISSIEDIPMGIFSQWRIFTKTEILLEKCIKENPFHPFHLLGSDDEPSAESDVAAAHAPPGKYTNLDDCQTCQYLLLKI